MSIVHLKLSITFINICLNYNKTLTIYILLLQCVQDMIEYLRDFARDGNEINAKEMLTSFNLDVICSVGFGIEAKSFSDSESKLTEMVRLKMRRTRKGIRSVTVLDY